MSKIGLDGHDRGIRLVTSFLRDAGMEVVFLGKFQSVQNILSSALQEDVDVIGISSLTGEHSTLVPELIDKLKEQGAARIPVVVGGTIPPNDSLELKRAGVRRIFSTGSSVHEVVEFMRQVGEETRKNKL